MSSTQAPPVPFTSVTALRVYLQRHHRQVPGGCWRYFGAERLVLNDRVLSAAEAAYFAFHLDLPGPQERLRVPCAVRRCVNPEHLQCEPRNKVTRLTAKMVYDLRCEYVDSLGQLVRACGAGGVSYETLAARVGCPVRVIQQAIEGETWSHVPPAGLHGGIRAPKAPPAAAPPRKPYDTAKRRRRMKRRHTPDAVAARNARKQQQAVVAQEAREAAQRAAADARAAESAVRAARHAQLRQGVLPTAPAPVPGTRGIRRRRADR